MPLTSPPASLPTAARALILVAVGVASAARGAVPDVAPWARVLADHARDGGLDYAALAAAPADLETYTASLAGAEPEALSEEERTAFWINAYNAVVTRLVIDRYPGIESVRDVAGFFDRLRFPVAGDSLTLDEIEDRALANGDPRVHFAVVCASTGCPELRAEPFDGARLDQQLAEQTRAFLTDENKGMRYEEDDNRLWLSSIFMWYADDFTGGSRVVAYFARGRVLAWVLDQLPAARAAELAAAQPAVRYLDYDWSLNDRPSGAR